MTVALAAPGQTLGTTNFSVQPEDVTGTQITAHFDTLPGNQPNSYNNTLWIWQTGSQLIPINTTGTSAQVVTNQPNGSYVFLGLSISEASYLVGFGVGADVGSIVSTVFIPATGGGAANPASANSAVNVIRIGSTSVSFSYATPPGSQPLANGDWVGLWQGQSEAALYSLLPTWKAQLNSGSSQGNYGINLPSGAVIQRGTVYTLGYFKGGWGDGSAPKQTRLACYSTFIG